MKISLVSFNCRSIKRSINHVADLCKKHDVIALQEHWLLPDDLGYLSGIHPDFDSHGISAVDTTTTLKGRPYGGVAILWRRSLFTNVTPIDTGSTRVAAVCFQHGSASDGDGSSSANKARDFVVMSIYMPTEDVENLPLFVECLGVLSAVIENNNVETVLMLGDYNADVSRTNSIFARELLEFCADRDWACSDLDLLGQSVSTYTYLSDAHGTTSWLDHCLTTSAGLSIIKNIYIVNDVFCSDHFPLVIECDIDIIMPKIDILPNQSNNKIIWGNRNCEQKCKYAKLCDMYLNSYNWYPLKCMGNVNKMSQKNVIEANYSNIIKCMSQAAKLSYRGALCRKKTVIGWNYHVKECHAIARQAYALWNNCGRPTQGTIYDSMIKNKKIFKNKIKWCQLNENKIKMDIIATHRYKKDFGSFWKETNKLNHKPRLPVTVSGCKDSFVIANMFANKYNPSTPAAQSSGAHGARGGVGIQPSSLQPAPLSPCDSSNENNVLHITPQDVSNCVKTMKRGKSPGHDGLSVEHILFGPVSLYEKIAILFNACISSNYLPRDFLRTIVVPIIKNRTGDVSNLSNYRPISLATILSKIFERLISKHLNENNISLNNSQFGFRKGLSTDLAIFSLKNTVFKYKERDTSVYACFLDLSRAFDTINYSILWNKLRHTKVPTAIIDVLEYWYENQLNQVKWGNTLSDTYSLASGVRQGGLTSPILFNLYINDLIEELSSTRTGCYIGGECLNNLSYADDMVLLSPSIGGLRRLVAICERFAAEHQLAYNVTKSEVMIFRAGKGPERVLPLKLCGTELTYVKQFKYLGHIICDTLIDDGDLDRQRRGIACRSNMLARRFYHCTDQVKITLFKAYCQSFYTSQLWYKYTKSAYNTLRVQYNNAFRAMLNLPWRCSATGMFAENRVIDFNALLVRLRTSFIKRLSECTNLIVKVVFKNVFILRQFN